ncbi:MAG: hypothetical protein ACREA3_06175 [Nitrosotalea sp.]
MTNSHNDDSSSEIHSVSLSVKCDKAVYPLGATVYTRVMVSDILVGKKISIEILDQNGKSLVTKKIDPLSSRYSISKTPFYQISFKMKGKQWKIGSKYTILARYGTAEVSDSYIINRRQPIIQTDKSVYMLGRDIILTVVDPDANLDSQKVETLGNKPNQRLTISTSMDKITNYRLVETGKNTGIFQGMLHLLPENSKKPKKANGPFDGAVRARRGDQITFSYFNGRESTTLHAYSSNFGATVQLDQKAYTWTDKVFIVVVAPDHDYYPNSIDEIKVKISTKSMMLDHYILRETGVNTGIFAGTITLTGNPKIKEKEGVDGKGVLPSGAYGGKGPSDGLLPADNDDKINVTFEFTEGQEVTGSAIVRWNIGEIKWLESRYNLESEATLQIVDPDMNLNPDAIDEFSVHVWSNSNHEGIQLKMRETGNATGIFQGKVFFSNKQESADGILKITEIDDVIAEYVDRTLPAPYNVSDNLKLTAMTRIGRTKPPLERVLLQNPVILDENGKVVTQIQKNQLMKITARIINNQNIEQPFAFMAQIQEEKSVILSDILHIEGLLKPMESQQPILLWMPELAGKYIIQLFVWKGKDNPSALSPPVNLVLTVF